jgi:hypothetical protein
VLIKCQKFEPYEGAAESFGGFTTFYIRTGIVSKQRTTRRIDLWNLKADDVHLRPCVFIHLGGLQQLFGNNWRRRKVRGKKS